MQQQNLQTLTTIIYKYSIATSIMIFMSVNIHLVVNHLFVYVIMIASIFLARTI